MNNLKPFSPLKINNWTPKYLTNLELFINSGIVTPLGGPVTNWNDQSGKGNDVISWGSNQPTVITNGFSTGINAIDLTALDAGVWAAGTPMYDPTQPFMIAMVIKGSSFDTTSSYYTLQTLRASGTNPYFSMYFLGSSYSGYYTRCFGLSDASTAIIGTNAFTYTNWNYIYLSYNGAGTGSASNYSLYINGISQSLSTGTGVFGSAPTGNNVVGNGMSSNTEQARWAMNVVVTNHLPSNTEKTNLDAYVNKVYGL